MKISQELLSDNYYNFRVDKGSGEPVPVDMLVLHCSAYNKDEMVGVLKKQGLSVHYIIETNGTITQLIEEQYRAWHAGAGTWYGVPDVNAHSVGIELVNPSLGHMTPYPERQIESLINLSQSIIRRWSILPHNVIAHSDLAPTRKFDPGRRFPWQKLAENGIGLYPDKSKGKYPEKSCRELLQTVGYAVADEAASLRAFVRHFAPEDIPEKEMPGKDYFDFLWHYEDNLPEVLKKQNFNMKELMPRLCQVAYAFKQSRQKS